MRGLGWQPQIALPDGLLRTVAEYREEVASGRVRG